FGLFGKEGDLYASFGRPYLEALVTEDPKYIPPYYQLASILAEMDRPLDAIHACEAGALQCLVTGDRKARAELLALRSELENA
ncbi:MAG TPA: hypothetical protein PKD45_00005, partial [Flavobacteriales bacterium]|nr:hypothetical protein [Flavobacteriales bacterium]